MGRKGSEKGANGEYGEAVYVQSALPAWPPSLWCIDVQVEVRLRRQQQRPWIGNEGSQRHRGQWWSPEGPRQSLASRNEGGTRTDTDLVASI